MERTAAAARARSRSIDLSRSAPKVEACGPQSPVGSTLHFAASKSQLDRSALARAASANTSKVIGQAGNARPIRAMPSGCPRSEVFSGRSATSIRQSSPVPSVCPVKVRCDTTSALSRNSKLI